MIFGFVGYGSIAKKHIHAISVLYPQSKIILLRRELENIDHEFNTIEIECTTHLDDLAHADFIFITNPTFLHLQIINQVIKFNKPLFIEKPLSDKMEGIELLVKNINESKIINYIGCNLRFHPCIIFLKQQLLHKLIINEVNVYCGSFLPDWRPNTNFREGYSANKTMGGGVHLDLIHELDYCYYLFGAPNNTRKILTQHSSLNINAIDYANYYWGYNEFSIQITLNYYRKDYKRTLEIVADDATYLIDFKKCTISKNDIQIFCGDNDFGVIYQQQMNYFVEQYKKSEKCFNDINEASEILKLCLYES